MPTYTTQQFGQQYKRQSAIIGDGLLAQERVAHGGWALPPAATAHQKTAGYAVFGGLRLVQAPGLSSIISIAGGKILSTPLETSLWKTHDDLKSDADSSGEFLTGVKR